MAEVTRPTRVGPGNGYEDLARVDFRGGHGRAMVAMQTGEAVVADPAGGRLATPEALLHSRPNLARQHRWRFLILGTVMVRKIDDLGRIVVPAETRRLFNIHEGDELGISVEDDAILLRKIEATCVFCGSTENVAPFKGRGLCFDCRTEVTESRR
jgi:transcriptional pleiotropic regulator of transition state genes